MIIIVFFLSLFFYTFLFASFSFHFLFLSFLFCHFLRVLIRPCFILQRRGAEPRSFLRFWSSLQLTFGEFADNHSASRGCDCGERRGHPAGKFSASSGQHEAWRLRRSCAPASSRESVNSYAFASSLISRASAPRRLCVENFPSQKLAITIHNESRSILCQASLVQ